MADDPRRALSLNRSVPGRRGANGLVRGVVLLDERGALREALRARRELRAVIARDRDRRRGRFELVRIEMPAACDAVDVLVIVLSGLLRRTRRSEGLLLTLGQLRLSFHAATSIVRSRGRGPLARDVACDEGRAPAVRTENERPEEHLVHVDHGADEDDCESGCRRSAVCDCDATTARRRMPTAGFRRGVARRVPEIRRVVRRSIFGVLAGSFGCHPNRPVDEIGRPQHLTYLS